MQTYSKIHLLIKRLFTSKFPHLRLSAGLVTFILNLNIKLALGNQTTMASSNNDMNWSKRRGGAARKVHQLWLLYRVRSILLLERNGVLYVYRTDETFPGPLLGPVSPDILETPSHFIMEASDEEPEVMGPEKEKKLLPGRRNTAMRKVHNL